MFRRSVTYHPLIKTISPDRHFDWKDVMSYQKDVAPDDNSTTKKSDPEEPPYRVLPITMGMISKLGFRVLPDRRLCFAGRTLKGIYLPKNVAVQIAIIKRFLVWYLPCIDARGKFYKLNNDCFARRENNFLKMYLKSLGYHHYLWNPLLPVHFSSQVLNS